LKVAIDCSHHPIPGGVRTYLDNLVPALGQCCPTLDLTLYYRTPRPPTALPRLPHSSSRIVHVPGPRRLWSWAERTLSAPPIEWQCGPIDVFHGTHFTLPVSRRAKLILTVHDVAYLKEPALYRDRRLNEYGYRTLLTNSLRRADRVLAISHNTRNDLIEECGVDPDRIWVVPFGWDQRLHPRPEEFWRPVVRSLGIDRPFVLFPAGSLDVRKNIDRALESFRLAFPGDRPLLVITGVATQQPSLTERLQELDLAHDVRLLRVSYPDGLEALMAGAEWGMYLSLYEGFGLPLLEMMGCGLPAVVSSTSAVPEVVGNAALKVDPLDVDRIAEGFLKVHESAILREQLRVKGISRASNPAFGWDRAAKQTLAAYRDDDAAYLEQPQPLATSESALVGSTKF